MSDIRGNGHGSAHDWRHDTTEPFNGDMGSRYFCRDCGACFVHMYNWFPDIFEAMRLGGVQANCVLAAPSPAALDRTGASE